MDCGLLVWLLLQIVRFFAEIGGTIHHDDPLIACDLQIMAIFMYNLPRPQSVCRRPMVAAPAPAPLTGLVSPLNCKEIQRKRQSHVLRSFCLRAVPVFLVA